MYTGRARIHQDLMNEGVGIESGLYLENVPYITVHYSEEIWA